jgi:predicted dehydrogenase
MSHEVRLGIIGCGQIAQQHLATYKDIPGATVVACADIDPTAASTTAAKFGIPHVYNSGWDLLKRDDLDAVDVCLHNNFHASAAIAVLESGRPCYCEKPMAGTFTDALSMLEASQRTGQKLHIQLAGLYQNEVRSAKELIEAGGLGDVYYARSNGHRRRGRPYVDGYGKPAFVQKENSGGGALYDMGVYHISEILWLLGNPSPERICGRTFQKLPMDEARRTNAGYSVEELGAGLVRFTDGKSLDILEAWAMHLDTLESSFVLGSEGGIRLRPFSYFRSVGDLDVGGEADLGAAAYRRRKLRSADGDTDNRDSSQRHWVAVLRGEDTLLPTAQIALNTMLISEGIYLSEKLGREVSADEVRALSVSTVKPL